MGKTFKIVYIPAHPAEPLEQWELPLEEGKEVECLLERLKAHFQERGPVKTAAQQQAQAAQLLAQLGPDAQVDPQLLSLATSMGMVENVNLLPNSRDNGFVGVNMYVDDEGSIKDLPRNPRASEIAHCCGRPLDVRGDAFLGRVFDDGDGFERLDMGLGEVASDAEWVRQAAAQNERKRREESSQQALLDRMRDIGQQRQAGAEQPSPASAAKERGNAAVKAGDWQAAVEHYSEALDLDAELAAARNNRSLALLKLGRWQDSESDSSWVLERDPTNVKALLRRASAREEQGKLDDALDDLQEVLKIQPQNKEAQQRLSALEQQQQQ